MKLHEIGEHTRYPTIGIFGLSGGGKTSLGATADRPLFADSNQGMSTLSHIPQLSHVRAVDVTGMPDLDKIYDNMTGTGGKDWSKKFKTVVFDHFDDIQQIILANLAERAQENREEPDQIEQREYGIMANKLRRYLRKMKSLPATKILIMGEKFMEQEGWMYPSLVGQMRDQLPYFLDHCIYLRVNDKGVRYLHLDPKPGAYYAKTRARWMPPEQRKIRFDLDNYTLLTDLIEKIRRGPDQSRRTKSRRKSK
jgi:hypothetical protein